jgi:hypothetical protein
MGKMTNAYKILVCKPEGRVESEDMGVDVKIILKWILGKQGGRFWSGFIWLSIGLNGGPL